MNQSYKKEDTIGHKLDLFGQGKTIREKKGRERTTEGVRWSIAKLGGDQSLLVDSHSKRTLQFRMSTVWPLGVSHFRTRWVLTASDRGTLTSAALRTRCFCNKAEKDSWKD